MDCHLFRDISKTHSHRTLTILVFVQTTELDNVSYKIRKFWLSGISNLRRIYFTKKALFLFFFLYKVLCLNRSFHYQWSQSWVTHIIIPEQFTTKNMSNIVCFWKLGVEFLWCLCSWLSSHTAPKLLPSSRYKIESIRFLKGITNP